MFGLIPRVMWEKVVRVDKEHRLELGLNCLLIETGKEKILVDSGIGDKLTPKKKAIYALEGENNLIKNLASLGLKETDIAKVILTHLHFDHSGGATRSAGQNIVPVFDRASYFVQRGEYKRAHSPDELSRASYLKENFIPLEEKGHLKLLDGDSEIIPGLRVKVTKGHTPFHQMVIVEGGAEKLAFWGDLIPTHWHLRLPWIPAYDRMPEETLELKKKMIEKALEEKWKMAFPHDPEVGICYLEEEGGELVARNL
jgi:glyoxylase-like metal-dependent hydrolase (beta-lactamase superfamily II)